jgi:hypothetical protein
MTSIETATLITSAVVITVGAPVALFHREIAKELRIIRDHILGRPIELKPLAAEVETPTLESEPTPVPTFEPDPLPAPEPPVFEAEPTVRSEKPRKRGRPGKKHSHRHAPRA